VNSDNRNAFHSLVEAAQLDPLLREVDNLCERRNFDGLTLLSLMCRQAVERGKQLWPIAEHITYRMVLEGPPEIAGPLVALGGGRFAPGPLTEVVASSHSFATIADNLPSPQARERVAAERVLRGEDLSADARAHAPVMEMPLRLLDFEPSYRVATFRKDHAEVEEPSAPAPGASLQPSSGETIEDDDLEAALLDLVKPWFQESGGEAKALLVEGGAPQAIGSLGFKNALAASVSFPQALELMAWAAASGGMHGRRRGAAYGRFAAWWAVAEMCELRWPPDALEFEDRGSELNWMVFEHPDEKPQGWRLGLAASSREDGWCCALYARDALQENIDT